MADTFAKKEKEQKKAKKKKDKAQKKEDRKTNNDKGKRLEDMIVYLDENGNITDKQPDGLKKTEIDPNDILLGAAPIIEETEFTGTVSFFSDKGYGFITEDKTKANVFVHSNKLTEPVKEKDRVMYEKEKTPKGYNAINVRKIK